MRLNESGWIRASPLGGERVYVGVVVFVRATGGRCQRKCRQNLLSLTRLIATPGARLPTNIVRASRLSFVSSDGAYFAFLLAGFLGLSF